MKMNTLTIVLGSIAALVALVLITAAFVRKDYAVEREVVIGQPAQQVFNYVKYVENQNHYSKWVMDDPNSQRTYKGQDGTVGYVSGWNSQDKNVGEGEQEIKKITPNERIDFEVRFKRPFEGVAQTFISTTPAPDNQTKVKWAMSSEMKYPMNVMLLFMNIEDFLGKDLETSLDRLKGVMEKEGELTVK